MGIGVRSRNVAFLKLIFIVSHQNIKHLKGVAFLAAGAIKNKKIIGALECLERFAYRKADCIVAFTNAVKVHIVAHGLDVILVAAEMLRDRKDILFLTAGDGAERQLSRHKN